MSPFVPDKATISFAKGGEVGSPIITIPAGRFACCLDPHGNSFGLFA